MSFVTRPYILQNLGCGAVSVSFQCRHYSVVAEHLLRLAAGLDDAISLTKGCFIGQEVIARLITYEKVQRKLAALRLERPMERGEEVTLEGEGVGYLTTVVDSGALAYLDVESAVPGTALDSATVVAFGS